MSSLLIKNGDLVLPDRVLEKADLLVKGGIITEVNVSDAKADEVIDAMGKYVLPGLIDIHCHGRLGFPNPETAADDLAKDCAELPATGVTRFLPTLASAPIENWHKVLPFITDAMDNPPPGALPVGAHLEGNFINPSAGGAHPGDLIRPFDPIDSAHLQLFEKWGEKIKIVTFAPEIPGNEKLIEQCVKRGIRMSLGHSAASPAQVSEFADQGVTHMCHLFNGMKPMDHRDPGPALGGLLDERITVEIICDGFHVHPDVIRLIHRMKAPGRRVLITDLVTLNIPGIESGGPDQPNRLPNGRLAGSRLRLISAVRNYIKFTGCDLQEAVAMASLVPATVAGIAESCGSIEKNKSADLCIADRDLNVETVFISGKRVH